MKKVTQLAVAIAMATGAITATPALAEVSASVGVASTYLWRGYDLGSGTPAVSGDLSYSEGGFYTGAWVSSGDSEAGTEYDLYGGWGTEVSGLTFDISLWNYNYPTGAGYTADGETDFGDLTDLVVSLGYGPVTFTAYDNIAGANGYAYYTLAAGAGDFTATLGLHDNETGEDPMHLNIDYAYNDNLTFTVSQFVSDEPAGDDLKFVVSYSLPIE